MRQWKNVAFINNLLFILVKRTCMKTSRKSKEKAENVNFVLEVCLMELDQDKIFNCAPDRILHSSPKPIW